MVWHDGPLLTFGDHQLSRQVAASRPGAARAGVEALPEPAVHLLPPMGAGTGLRRGGEGPGVTEGVRGQGPWRTINGGGLRAGSRPLRWRI